jgi:prepilin-type processing-associated H-X9-DG protein
MVAEAAGINWIMNGPGYTPNSVTAAATAPVPGEVNWMVAIAGRHGRGANRNHALTNIAFFDGHVTTFDTKVLASYTDGTNGGGTVIPQSVGVVFTISQAR